MSKILFILKRSVAQVFKNLKASGIIVFSLTICSFATLILLAATQDRYYDLLDTIDMKKMWLFGDITISKENDSYPFFDTIFSDKFPGVDSFVSLNARVAGGEEIKLVYSKKEAPDQELMAEGRTYTDSELNNGDFVAIVNISDCGNKKLGEKINIGETDFEIIGKTYAQTSVPLFSAMKLGWSIKVGDVTFNDFLDEDQEAFLRQTVNEISENQVITTTVGDGGITTHFDLFGRADYDLIKRAIISLLALLVISGIIIGTVFNYSVNCRMREFNIYKTLGANKSALLGLFYAPPLFMLAISLILGAAVFKLSYHARKLLGIETRFSPAIATLAVFLIFILMLTVTLPKYLKVLLSSPKDGEGLT